MGSSRTALVFWTMSASLLVAPTHLLKAQDNLLALDVIIANVAANEHLYDNIDVFVEQFYDHKLREGLSTMHILESHLNFHFVNQDNLFRLKTDKTQVVNSDKKPVSHRDAIGYDGEKTRTIVIRPAPESSTSKESKLANIKDGRGSAGSPFCPHTELIPKYSCQVPLSVWLRGGKDLANHPNAQDSYRSGKWVNRTSVVGRENIRDVRCIKLRCELWDTKANLINTLRFMWLAEDKNYIPVQSIAYLPPASTEKPIATGSADGLKEVQPGIWLPMKYHREVYDLESLRDFHKHVLATVEDWSVKKVSLDPHYPPEFFRDVEFPPGTLVYEVKNEKITNSYRTDEVPKAASKWARVRWWMLGLLAVILAAGVVWNRWKYRRAASQA
jgi:hypothetical protein